MTLDVDQLATRAAAPLKGRVKRREVQEVIASAVIVAVNQALDQAEELLAPKRIAAALSIRRHLGVTTMRRLEQELGAVAQDLRSLRLKPCPEIDAAAPARAFSPPPLSCSDR